MMRRWAPPTRYTLRRNTASIIKDLIWLRKRFTVDHSSVQTKTVLANTEGGLTQDSFFSSPWKNMRFFASLFICRYPRQSDCYMLDKEVFQFFFFLSRGFSPVWKYFSHRSYTKFLKKNVYQYTTVYLMWIWAYINADKKVHTFSWRRKT